MSGVEFSTAKNTPGFSGDSSSWSYHSFPCTPRSTSSKNPPESGPVSLLSTAEVGTPSSPEFSVDSSKNPSESGPASPLSTAEVGTPSSKGERGSLQHFFSRIKEALHHRRHSLAIGVGLALFAAGVTLTALAGLPWAALIAVGVGIVFYAAKEAQHSRTAVITLQKDESYGPFPINPKKQSLITCKEGSVEVLIQIDKGNSWKIPLNADGNYVWDHQTSITLGKSFSIQTSAKHAVFQITECPL